jgi:PRTRC genetic system protein C
MAETKILKRVFKFKNDELPDPNVDLTPDKVKEFYANQYPELINATMGTPQYEEDKVIYPMETNLGTKG